MNDLYFEDFSVGQKFETGSRTFTEDDIVAFGRRYAPLPYHTDPVAAKDSMYGGVIAAGYQTAAATFGLFVEAGVLRASAMGSPGVDKLRWLKPVRPGDTIFVEANVTGTRLSSKGDRGYVSVAYEVKNQKGEAVLTMTGTQIIALRPSREPRPKTKAPKAK
jgi:acyl dehydratase